MTTMARKTTSPSPSARSAHRPKKRTRPSGRKKEPATRSTSSSGRRYPQQRAVVPERHSQPDCPTSTTPSTASAAREPSSKSTPANAATPQGQLDPESIKALNHQAAVLENAFFPAQVLASLRLDTSASVTAVRLYLARFREEAGPPNDPVEKILLDNLAVAHLKVGELHALAASATPLDFKQLYHNAAMRLLETICRLVTTLTTYRGAHSTPRRQRRRKKAETAAGQQQRCSPSKGKETRS